MSAPDDLVFDDPYSVVAALYAALPVLQQQGARVSVGQLVAVIRAQGLLVNGIASDVTVPMSLPTGTLVWAIGNEVHVRCTTQGWAQLTVHDSLYGSWGFKSVEVVKE